jgi:hypothetical protein
MRTLPGNRTSEARPVTRARSECPQTVRLERHRARVYVDCVTGIVALVAFDGSARQVADRIALPHGMAAARGGGGLEPYDASSDTAIFNSGLMYDQWTWTLFHVPSIARYTAVAFHRATIVSLPSGCLR